MIGWIILCIIIIAAAFTSAVYNINTYISLLIMLSSLVPGYFIFKLSMLTPKIVHKKEHNNKKQFKSQRGKVVNFPEGGRKKFNIK